MKATTMEDGGTPAGQEISLPLSTPGVSDLVKGWEDGGEYHVKITQIATEGENVKLRIEPMMENEPEEDEGEEMPSKSPNNPSVPVRYKS